MNIGIYGDSYADKIWDAEVWWRLLESKYDHRVTCYGEHGSSILFSAHLLEQHHQQHDLNVWCLTTPGRWSFQDVDGHWIHTTGVIEYMENSRRWDDDTKRRLQACKDYLKYMLDFNDENFIGKAIAHYHLAKGNVMIIPCFKFPLRTDNNLFEACCNEIEHYFGRRDIFELYQEWQDMRPAHFTPANNRVLAEMINQNLRPGIMQIDLDKFVAPDVPLDQAFRHLK